ncbi:hypothetical protein [Microlunatus ginsengisoli]|uniref:Right handed beta helix region n=1 Tax=Microlunatus ginsengisoli TaxID=363863 RepID=A0ABP7ARP0_9ACTN
MRSKSLLAVAVGAALVALAAPTAQAAPPRVPLTCGMVLTRDATVYLTHDLTCRTSVGVEVDYPEGEDYPAVPHVTVDLRGHTLRGSGKLYSVGIGGGSDEGGSVQLRVINGRAENWTWGVFGGSTSRVERMKLTGNQVGYGCNSSCALIDSYLARNKDSGLSAADAGVTVRGTIFADNPRGIHMAIGGLDVRRSVFARNTVGIEAPLAGTSVAKSAFLDNDTAISVGDNCPTLSYNVFVRNGTDVDSTC